MLGGLGKSIQKIFGTKYDRDVKNYAPIVEEINEIFEDLQGLSNDELRNKTLEFRARIKEYLSEIDAEIAEIKQEIEDTEDLYRKEELFKEIDELEKAKDKEQEVVLKEILPHAFAVVKETARRFSQNESIEVTATDHDREMAAKPKKTYIKIDGNRF